jgi:lysophospholipase L1-like esterase
VFFGDSITEQADEPDGFLTIIRTAFADNNNESIIINAGVGGDKVTDLLKRLDDDILSKKPTIVVIYIGINDVWHYTLGIGGTPKNEYRTNLKEIIGRIQAAQAKVILCTPSVIGEYFEKTDSINTMLDEYCGISREVAAGQNVELCDLRSIFVQYLSSHNPNKYIRGILTTDMVHLNKEGNALVAHNLLPMLKKSTH